MSEKKVWFITGAGRGMGLDFTKAVLQAGDAVVATGREPDGVARAIGKSNDLLRVKLDVTCRADAEAAMQAALDRFGRVDVLVNNAASFYAGYFEELTPEQFERQLAVSLIGPMNVRRAALPVMRKQHSGHIISIRPNWRERSLPLRARSRRRAVSSPALMRLPPPSKRSPT